MPEPVAGIPDLSGIFPDLISTLVSPPKMRPSQVPLKGPSRLPTPVPFYPSPACPMSIPAGPILLVSPGPSQASQGTLAVALPSARPLFI